MTGLTPERTRGAEPEPENELQALLWVLAGLLATLGFTWWFFARMYGG